MRRTVQFRFSARKILPVLVGGLLVLAWHAGPAAGWPGGEEQPNECPCPTGGVGGNLPNDSFGLGAANTYSVFEMGANKVDMTGPPGGVFGDVAIAAGGKLSMTGSQFITGTVFLGPGATFSNSTHGSPGGGVQTGVDLSAAISDAENASANFASSGCDQSFGTLSGGEMITATGAGNNIICVQNIVLNGGKVVTLNDGGFGARMVLNVSGKLVLTGGSDILVSGSLPPFNVLYNILGSGPDVALNGGGGGENCCNSTVDGTLLAIHRRIALSPGLVRGGAVMSAENISIVSGARVTCPLQCPAP
jgi:hypothetical protein